MREEEAFLDRLAEDPLDGLTRSVYADWLEDRGDERAAFLRAEAAFAASGTEAALAEADRLAAIVDEGWMLRAGAKWGLVLREYPPRRKIPAIKKIRELRLMGLLAAKRLSEALPAVVLPGAPWFLASAGRREFHALMLQPYDPYPERPDEPPIAAALEPASEESAKPGPARALPYYDSMTATAWLRLEEVRPEHALEVARALVPRLAASLFTALDVCAGPKPAHLESPLGEVADEELIHSLAGKARLSRVEAVAGDRRFDWVRVRAGKAPPEEMARASRAFVRVVGRDALLTGEHGWPEEGRCRRFRAEEVAARLGGVVEVRIEPEGGR
ncbi:MAG: TIGR02996 domain-containing protein [Gemmataceae bacterium]|nr:TIGR02996 domain-containing protein [Gemmataceae bacterium]